MYLRINQRKLVMRVFFYFPNLILSKIKCFTAERLHNRINIIHVCALKNVLKDYYNFLRKLRGILWRNLTDTYLQEKFIY